MFASAIKCTLYPNLLCIPICGHEAFLGPPSLPASWSGAEVSHVHGQFLSRGGAGRSPAGVMAEGRSPSGRGPTSAPRLRGGYDPAEGRQHGGRLRSGRPGGAPLQAPGMAGLRTRGSRRRGARLEGALPCPAPRHRDMPPPPRDTDSSLRARLNWTRALSKAHACARPERTPPPASRPARRAGVWQILSIPACAGVFIRRPLR